MFNFTHIARQALLALSLAFASGAALAGPAYLVTIHTALYSGESGLLDFGFLGDAAATGDMVTLSNFSGAFDAEYDRAGGVTGSLPGAVVFSNTGSANYLTQAVVLGGDFTFKLSFSGDYAMPADPADAIGLTFVVALFDASLTEVLADLVRFDLLPFNAGEAASVVVTANLDLVDVAELAEVPEPSQLLLVLGALALAGVALRRRSSSPTGC